MTIMQDAWMIYAAGSLGCCIAAWWMFLWAWRFIRYSAVVTVMVILGTPYAIDPQTMQMAPAIYTVFFEGMAQGIDGIRPLIKLMLGIWLIAITLVVVFVVLTRGGGKATSSSRKSTKQQDNRRHNPRPSQKAARSDHAPRMGRS